MEAVGAASAIVGLAIPVFQCAKALRDRIKQVASEKAEISAALVEYEKDINLLESLYNEHKELLDQRHLDADLKELEQIIRDLDEWLNSINPNLGKKKLLGIKELWRVGDLQAKVVAANAKISSIRNRWQMRLQVCTLASTTAIIGRLDHQDGSQTEMMGMLHQMMVMLQQGPVRQRSRSLSMHSQVEPAGFNSQTTRVVASTTTSIVTFSILSPDASLSYDRIKLRLGEYRTLLASDSDTIELPTENGKTVLCRKQANEMEQFLDEAETLLRDIAQSRDVSTIEVVHCLRGLAKVLDNLKLYDECRLTGNCALGLAEALGRRSLEFRSEQAETLALIAGLSVYQPRARTLFIQAVSICEEVVETEASDSNKMSLFIVLNKAGYWAGDHPDLGVQWLEHAVQLMTNKLPSTMVPAPLRSAVYANYGCCLHSLKQHSKASEVEHKAVSIYRTLASETPATYIYHLALSLESLGQSLRNLGKYDAAAAAHREALELCRTLSAQDTLQYSAQLAKVLNDYGITLKTLNQFSEAAERQKEAISLYHHLAQTSTEYDQDHCIALYNYGNCCYSLGQHTNAVLAYQESIPLRHAWVTIDPGQTKYLLYTLHDMAHCLHALGQDDNADGAATEALQMMKGEVLKSCRYAPNFSSCIVCQRAILPHSVTTLDDTSTPLLLPKSSGGNAAVSERRKRDMILGFFHLLKERT